MGRHPEGSEWSELRVRVTVERRLNVPRTRLGHEKEAMPLKARPSTWDTTALYTQKATAHVRRERGTVSVCVCARYVYVRVCLCTTSTPYRMNDLGKRWGVGGGGCFVAAGVEGWRRLC